MFKTLNLSIIIASFLFLCVPVFAQIPYGGRVLTVTPCLGAFGLVVTLIPASIGSPPLIILPFTPVTRLYPWKPPTPGSFLLGSYFPAIVPFPSPIPDPTGTSLFTPPLGCIGPISIFEGGSLF